MKLSNGEIDAVCDLVADLCGIYLDQSKDYLIEARLGEIATRNGCASYTDLVRRAQVPGDTALRNEVIDAITTNETLFFRDNSPFEAMRHKAVPELIDRKAKTPFPSRLRFWSAACSTGQEPYSLAIMLTELLGDPYAWDIQILATDISGAAIAQASRGWYAPHEICRGLAPEVIAKYFRPENGGWRINDSLRGMVTFQRLNLLEPFSTVGRFDVVLCRNAAIYFTPPARADLFERLAGVMNPDGYLFVGSQECLSDLGPRFAPQHHCRAVFYRPNSLAARPANSTPASRPTPVGAR